MPGFQDPFPGDPQRAWQRLANPVRIAVALGSRIQGGIDPTAVLRHDKVCVCLDGWSEFTGIENVVERTKAIRALQGIQVIANGRQTSPSDTTFESWRLGA
jgi:hypothetical protein